MWWLPKGARPISTRSAQRTLTKIVVATVLLIGGMIGTAAACPHGKHAAPSQVIDYKTERVLPPAKETVSAAPVRIVTAFNRTERGQCCGAGCHSHGIACATGCCLAGVASINSIISNFFLPANAVRLLLIDQAEIISARPPPEFRPPRTFS
jgi:hypothetical protein